MKLTINKKLLGKIIKILKWGKIVAKFTAIGTTVSGAITAFSGSATSGVALSAAGATTYAATKGLPSQGYEKTKHIPPGRVDRTANMLRQQDLVRAAAKNGMRKMPGGKMLSASALQAKTQSRIIATMPTGTLLSRKK